VYSALLLIGLTCAIQINEQRDSEAFKQPYCYYLANAMYAFPKDKTLQAKDLQADTLLLLLLLLLIENYIFFFLFLSVINSNIGALNRLSEPWKKIAIDFSFFEYYQQHSYLNVLIS
jgi:hypothetical protein